MVTRQGEKPRPTVAVDNVCAWPNLTLPRDGTIAAVIFSKPCHACIVGDVECWVSADAGRTWEKRGVPAAHDPPSSNRMNRGRRPGRQRRLTAYYASAIEGHPRYHMGVVVWDPQKSYPAAR